MWNISKGVILDFLYLFSRMILPMSMRFMSGDTTSLLKKSFTPLINSSASRPKMYPFVNFHVNWSSVFQLHDHRLVLGTPHGADDLSFRFGQGHHGFHLVVWSEVENYTKNDDDTHKT